MSAKIPALKYFDLAKSDNLTEKDLNDYTNEIKAVCSKFPSQIEELKPILSKKYDKVYAIGIGDSLYSADSAKLDFWGNSGIQMEVLESQEFNNYFIDFMPRNSLVLICSGGGSAGRTVESSYLAQNRGATVVAVTLSPTSRLSSSCKNVLCFSTNKNSFIDGSRNYISLTLLIKLIGIKMGIWNGVIQANQESALLDKIVADCKVGFKTCMTNEKLMKEIMLKAKDQHKFYFLGAGPSLPLTQYGAAKFMEQAATDGIWQQLEEYGHEQYWVHNRKGINDTIFSICPAGKSVVRCAENMDEHNFLDLNTVLVTTNPIDPRFLNKARFTIATDEFIDEKDFWMAAGNIFARLANFYTKYIGFSEKVFLNEQQFVEHYKTIHYTRFCQEVSQFDIPIPDDKTITERGAYGLTFNKSEENK
jgi:glutamine---fructose-6-phosphate transaminase (isomerizing)